MYDCAVILYAKVCHAFDVWLFISRIEKWDRTLCLQFCVSTGTVGGADGSTGEDPAGAGHHQAASVVHSTVSAREGSTPAQPSPGQTEAAAGDSGDEVSHTFFLYCDATVSCTCCITFDSIPLWKTFFSLKLRWVELQKQTSGPFSFCVRLQGFRISGLLQLLPCDCFSVMFSRVWSTSAPGRVSFICTKTLTKHQTGHKHRTWLLLALSS